MPRNGLLIVTTNPAPDFEEELNAWYETDHLPERLAVPGFEWARRYVMATGAHRYLALYGLQGIEVLRTPAYLAVAEGNFTPWTRRVISRGRFQRFPAVQIDAKQGGPVVASRLLLLRFKDLDRSAGSALVRAAEQNFAGRPEVRQVRVFQGLGDEQADLFVLVDGHGALDALVRADILGEAAAALDTVSLYHPY